MAHAQQGAPDSRNCGSGALRVNNRISSVYANEVSISSPVLRHRPAPQSAYNNICIYLIRAFKPIQRAPQRHARI